MTQIRTYLLLLLFFCFAQSNSTLAIQLNGSIALENSSGSHPVLLSINQSKFEVNSGGFSVDVNDDKLYEVKITAKGYYPSVQTFSHYELTALSSSPSEKAHTIPSIRLVKRAINRVMFAFGGDVMMGRRYGKPYFNEPVLIRSTHRSEDTRAIVQHIKSYMEVADFSVVNLETQIGTIQPKKRAPKNVTFYSPPETIDALTYAGIDYVTLGNNHTYDYLEEGLTSTLQNLRRKGLPYSGAGQNEKDALAPYYATIGDSRYAMLGFVGWEGGVQPSQVASKNKGGAAWGNAANILQTVEKESKLNIPTVIQYHGSLEYSDEPSGVTESRLKSAIEAGADLAIVHHPHVTQGFEIYQGKLIAYSMGNLIFDQYFHATSHSYILYVWMDGEQFYQAEIVPVYLKGYVPTPATGRHRNIINKRVRELSQRRGIKFSHSGDHLVIDTRILNDTTTDLTFEILPNQKNLSLYHFPSLGELIDVRGTASSMSYRLGKEQLNGGSFETYNSYSSDERSWMLVNVKLNRTFASQGEFSLEARLKKSEPAVVGMKTFRRVFKAANSMTYQAKIRNSQRVLTARLFLQTRKNGAKFLSALSQGKKTLLKEIQILPSENWQNIEVDFDLPRVGYRSYRIFLELTAGKNFLNESWDGTTKVHLDDISLIEWQAHYQSIGKLPRNSELLNTATHLGLRSSSAKIEKIKLKFVK